MKGNKKKHIYLPGGESCGQADIPVSGAEQPDSTGVVVVGNPSNSVFECCAGDYAITNSGAIK